MAAFPTGRPPHNLRRSLPAIALRGVFRTTRVVLALALFMAVLINAVLSWQADRAIDALEAREFELVRQARALEGKAVAVLSDGRGYLVVQDTRFLDDFAQDRDAARAVLARLRELAHTPEGEELVTRIGAELEQVIGGVEQRFELVQQEQLTEARGEFFLGQTLQRDLIASINGLVEHEERQLRDRLDDLRRQRLAGLLASALLVGLVGVLGGRLLDRGERALRASQERQRLAVEATEAAIREREEFMAAVSHDLRSPLTSIKGFTQLLARRARRAGTAESEAIAQGLARIDGVAARMTALIDELMDVARLQSGRPLELRPEPVDLVALARETVAEHRHAAAGHPIMVEARRPEMAGEWDRARLERVLANLLSNATKYSPESAPVTVTVAHEESEPEAAGWAVLAVRDEGVGIPAADLPHIFEQFHRGANVGSIRGTGIGLAGARRIVEQHGGTIAVSSIEGAGTTVTVRLPYAAPCRGDDAPDGAGTDGVAAEAQEKGPIPAG